MFSIPPVSAGKRKYRRASLVVTISLPLETVHVAGTSFDVPHLRVAGRHPFCGAHLGDQLHQQAVGRRRAPLPFQSSSQLHWRLDVVPEHLGYSFTELLHHQQSTWALRTDRFLSKLSHSLRKKTAPLKRFPTESESIKEIIMLGSYLGNAIKMSPKSKYFTDVQSYCLTYVQSNQLNCEKTLWQ